MENSNYVDKDGNATEELIRQYASVSGMTADEVREKVIAGSLSAETMATGIATEESYNELDESLQDTAKRLDELAAQMKRNNQSMDSLRRVLSANGGKITQEDQILFNQAVAAAGGKSLNLSNEEDQRKVVEQYLTS
jgi:hypothetical protein